MTEYRYARIEFRLLGDIIADFLAAASTFSHNDEDIAFAFLISSFHILTDLIEVKRGLRNEDVLRTARDTGYQCKPARAAAHNLHDDNAAVCRSRITELVDGIDNRISSRIAANRVVRTPDIVINRARQADDRNARLLRKQRSTAQGAVTTDDAEALNATVNKVLIAEHTAFRRLPAFAAGRSQERTTALDDITNVFGLHLKHIFFKQTMITITDTPDFYAFIESRTNNCTSCCVHSRAVATAGHDCNAF